MGKIDWCKKQKSGITLVEQNPNLAQAYILKAEDALKTLHAITSKDWKISTAYYSMYFSLYSILTKIGVKCEIHSCTIEFAKVFLKDYFSKEELDLIEKSQSARVDAQYFVDKTVPDEFSELMIKKAPDFLIKCKAIKEKLTEKKIADIRNKI
jgi:uncharacterized protein (UPF0332 family)